MHHSERGTFVYRNGELVRKEQAERLFPRGPRSNTVPVPYLNLDTVAPFVSMADGKTYDSKAAYRRTLKEGGYNEIGTDTEAHLKEARTFSDPSPVAPFLKEAYQAVRQGYKPEAPVVQDIANPDLD